MPLGALRQLPHFASRSYATARGGKKVNLPRTALTAGPPLIIAELGVLHIAFACRGMIYVLVSWTTVIDYVLQLTISFFAKILNNSDHVIETLLPPPVVKRYNLRHSKHHRQLPERTSHISLTVTLSYVYYFTIVTDC